MLFMLTYVHPHRQILSLFCLKLSVTPSKVVQVCNSVSRVDNLIRNLTKTN
jgi:hypothetical protein